MTTQITTENYYTTLSQLPKNHINKIIQKIAKNHGITLGQLSKITNIPESTLDRSNNRTLNFYQFKTLANFENKTVSELMFNYLNESENSKKINIINQEDEQKIYEDFKDKLEPYMIQNYFDYLVTSKNIKKTDIAKELQISKQTLSTFKRYFHNYTTMKMIAQYFNMSLNDFLTESYEYNFNKINSNNYKTSIYESTQDTKEDIVKKLNEKEFFVNQLQSLLNQRKISKKDLAKLTGYAESTVRSWLNQNNSYIPSEISLRNLSIKLGVPITYFTKEETIQNYNIKKGQIYQNILAILRQNNKTIEWLSEQTGIKYQTIYGWYRRTWPNDPFALDRIANVLNVDVETLLKENEKTHNDSNLEKLNINPVLINVYGNIKKGQIYQNILTILSRNNKTIKWLSEQTGIKYQTITGWSKRTHPKDFSALNRVANVLNVDVKTLLKENEILRNDSNLEKLNIKPILINEKDLFQKIENLTHNKSDFEKAFIKNQIKNTIHAIYG